MFQVKVVEEIKTQVLYSLIFYPQISFRLWDGKEQGRARQVNSDKKWRMFISCCIT
jgi:hypothetical protein